MNSSEYPSQDSVTLKPRQKREPLTANACTECRRRRSKCDGGDPCSLCVARGVSACEYQVHERTAKKIMVEKIGALNHRHKMENRILRAIATHKDGDDIVQQLKGGESYEAIARQIESLSLSGSGSDQSFTDNRSTPFEEETTSVADQGGSKRRNIFDKQRQRNNTAPASTKLERKREPYGADDISDSIGLSLSGIDSERGSSEDDAQAIGPGPGAYQPSSSGFTQQADVYTNITESWTNVTADKALVDDLLALYFCWEYPAFASFSKVHFLYHFRTRKRRFCSSLLVNVILSLACRFSDNTEARLNLYSGESAGDRFFEEARAILAGQEDQSLPTIQALALMSLREASCGRSDNSRFYGSQSIRMAIESELHLDQLGFRGLEFSTEEREVRSTTFWGCFALDQVWSLFTGGVPYISRRAICTPAPIVVKDLQAEEWTAYNNEGLLLGANAKSSRNTGLVFRSLCGLSVKINDALYLFYSPGEELNIQKILDLHTQYLQWYNLLPEVLRRGQDFTPSALFLHMLYHCAILLLFRPFLRFSFAPSSVSPSEICFQAAGNLTTLMRSYRQLHTFRRTPTFTPYIILNTAIVALVDTTLTGAVSLPSILKDSLDDLAYMSVCHGFANHAVIILRILANQRGIILHRSSGYTKSFPTIPTTSEGPLLLSLAVFRPSKELFSVSADGAIINIASHDSVLRKRFFSPFPYQGLPLLPVRDVMALHDSPCD